MPILLSKAEDGPLAGFVVLPVEFHKFVRRFETTIANGVTYQMGAKADPCGADPIPYSEIDCSGFARDLLAEATAGVALEAGLPDGSWNQDAWYGKVGVKRTVYANCGENDGILRVAVHLPGGRGGDPTGHTWFCLSSPPPPGVVKVPESIESYGENGPGRRPWNHQWFLDSVDHTYCLAAM